MQKAKDNFDCPVLKALLSKRRCREGEEKYTSKPNTLVDIVEIVAEQESGTPGLIIGSGYYWTKEMDESPYPVAKPQVRTA
jgi:hypothetical protein